MPRFSFLIFLPAAVVIAAFAVLNRHGVPLHLLPGGEASGAGAITLPAFLLIFLPFLLGFGFAALIGTRRAAALRKRARRAEKRADAAETRAERLAMMTGRTLPPGHAAGDAGDDAAPPALTADDDESHAA